MLPPGSSEPQRDLEMSMSGGRCELQFASSKLRDEDSETVPIEVDYSEDACGDDAAVQFSFKRLLVFAGPGLLMSIAYVDPGNLESDLQTGTQAGYKLGWLILWSTVLGFIVQLLAVRLGVVTGRDLARTCRAVYPAAPRVLLWLMTEVAIIGSDIQEVIGSAIAIQLLSNGAIPLWAGVLITGLDTFALLYLERFGVRKLEAFFGLLVGIMTLSFGAMYIRAEVPALEVAAGIALPRVSWSQLSVATGIVGSLVMPHNIFLHSALVQSRKIDLAQVGAKREAILYNAVESALSLSITVFINIFVMAVFAAGFHARHVAEGLDVGLSTAGRYLQREFGSAMMYVWALGLLAAGQSSTMTGTYTGQFVMQGFLDMQVSAWVRAAVTRSVALVPTLAVAIAYAGSTQMDVLNQGLNVLQSVQLPFALIPVLYVTSRADIMGERFAVRSTFKVVVYLICAALLAINLSVVSTYTMALLERGWVIGTMTLAAGVLYAAAVVYLLLGPRLVYDLLSRSPLPGAATAARALGFEGVPERDELGAGELGPRSDALPLVGRETPGASDLDELPPC